MSNAQIKIIFYDAHTFQLKNAALLNPVLILNSFNDEDIIVFTEIEKLSRFLQSQEWKNATLLMMSSGNFSGLDLQELSTFVTTHS